MSGRVAGGRSRPCLPTSSWPSRASSKARTSRPGLRTAPRGRVTQHVAGRGAASGVGPQGPSGVVGDAEGRFAWSGRGFVNASRRCLARYGFITTRTGPILVKMRSFSRRRRKEWSIAPKLTSPRPTMSSHAASVGSESETMLQAATSASGLSTSMSTPGGASSRRRRTWPLCGPRITVATTHASSSETESLRGSGGSTPRAPSAARMKQAFAPGTRSGEQERLPIFGLPVWVASAPYLGPNGGCGHRVLICGSAATYLWVARRRGSAHHCETVKVLLAPASVE